MNILVTSIGSFSADCVINSLKELHHIVVGCDINPKEWIVAAKDCDSFYQVPLCKNCEHNYISAIIEICRIEETNILIPLTDVEVDVLNKHRALFDEIDCKLCIQSDACLRVARNKWNMFKYFQDEKVFKVPNTILCNEDFETSVKELKLPCVLKPISGRSSEGLFYIDNLSDFNFSKTYENYIVQEYIKGSIFTVDYLRDSFSNDFSIVREELLRTKNGAGTTVRVAMNHKLGMAASFIGDKLGIIGAVNFEFIFDGEEYYLIDINPRFSAGIAFSQFVGYDIVKSCLNSVMGNEIIKPICYDEKIICKRYREELI